MRVSELFEGVENLGSLKESIDFGVAKYIKNDTYPDGLYSMAEFEREEIADCPECEGTGSKDGEICGWCDGKKKVKQYKTDYDDLNVNNTNGMLILRDLFGIPQPDSAGHIEQDQLPEILNKLKAMKRDHGMEFFKRVQGKLDNPGVARAKHNIPYRWSDDDVNHYLNRLINIIEFAIKNDATLVWS